MESFSFTSLAEHILSAEGGSAVQTLSDAGRAVLVRRALEELQDNVHYYYRHRRSAAFCQMAAETIDVTLPGEDVVIGKKHPLNIVLDELVYVGTEERMLIFHRAEPAAPLKSRMSLRTLEEKLAEEGFLRIHNSFLVNMSYIAALQTSGVTLTTGQVLPVSLHGYKAIKMKYMAWRGRG